MNFSFFRKPLKPVLYSIILIVLSAIALVFSIQYVLDGIAIDEAVNKYAYVGTVYNNKEDFPLLKPLPEDIVKSICESRYVSSAEKRRTLSGKSDDRDAILDYFISDDTLDLYGMLEGIIGDESMFDPVLRVEHNYIKVQKRWASVPTGMSIVRLDIQRNDASTEPILHAGDRVLITGKFFYDDVNHGMNQNQLAVNYDEETANVLDKNSVIFIPADLDRSAADAYVEKELTERGIFDYVEKINNCRRTFTIKPVTDMAMLMGVAEETTFVSYGRGIEPSDAGKKVCVINQFVASKNWLYVGDTINLAVADGGYVVKAKTHNADWETGYPGITDEVYDFPETEPYEIIGIYNFKFRNVNEDLSKFGRNDIFIPADEEATDDYSNVTPYCFSFKIKGPDYEKFMEEFEMDLFDRGYVLKVADSGWEDFSVSYISMIGRRIVSISCAILSFMAAVAVFVILLTKHFSYEFGLRRLLGASVFEAMEVFSTSYFVFGIPSVLLASAATSLVYKYFLSVRMASVVETELPSVSEAFKILIAFSGAELICGFILLSAIAICTGRKNLLRLIK